MSVCDNCGAEVWPERRDDGWDRLNAFAEAIEQMDRYQLRPNGIHRSQDGAWVAWKDVERLRDAALEG